MLIFVNPYGGKRKAVRIFEKTVKPILEVSNVQWTLVTTQRRNHVTEYLTSLSPEKLMEYDVAVAVGGDGTICEVITGLLVRNMDTNANRESNLKPADLFVAVIPAGSSNALAMSLNGTGDAETAAIHMVLGGSVPLDVGAIHSHEGVVRFIVTQMSYGHLADTLQESEKLRWMGPKRYDYAGFRKFVKHAAYEGSIDMKLVLDESRKGPTECGGGDGCGECNSEVKTLDGKSKVEQWKRVEGKFLGVSGANVSCRCVLSPRGIAPFAHVSDGCLDLILIRKASRFSYLQYLLKIGGDSRSSFALPFVERYRVAEFSFTPMQCCGSNAGTNYKDGFAQSPDQGSSSSLCTCSCDTRQQKKNHSLWNCDGELLYQPSIRVTVHQNLVRIMSRKMSDAQPMLPSSTVPEPDPASLA
jgi:ceramide kinase